jgi:CubicO group peptidase (beta-lactamase class C family)
MLKSALDRGSSAIRSIVMADRTIFHTQQGGRAAKVIVESLSAVSFLVIAGLLAGEPVAIAQENPQGKSDSCARDNGGITLSPGFCATVFADNLGHARQMARSTSTLGVAATIGMTSRRQAAFSWRSRTPRMAAAPTPPEASIEQQIEALAPSLKDYIATNMKSFDVPGLAIGIVAGDKLVYAKGFGVRNKGGAPVDTQTIFQIGSTTKAFLSATIAIAVDQGKLHWDDRIVDLDPDFQMRDPWVTREFRVFDLLAQRSGLPPYVNDFFGVLGFDRSTLIRSLRYVEPVSSFRSTFAYTNITHILAGRIVAKAEGAADWNVALQKEILDPLGMKNTTYSAAAITAAANHPLYRRWKRRGALPAACSVQCRRRWGHQLQHRGHGEVGQLAACGRHHTRRPANRLGREPRLQAHAEGSDQ